MYRFERLLGRSDTLEVNILVKSKLLDSILSSPNCILAQIVCCLIITVDPYPGESSQSQSNGQHLDKQTYLSEKEL